MAEPGAADAAEGATAVNKDLWTRINAEYTDEQALRSWAAEDISWGVFNVPEAELDVLGDVADLDVVDLGGGTAYLSAWLARRGARPVGVDLTAAQLDTARRCQARFGISFPLIEADAAQVPLPGATANGSPSCAGPASRSTRCTSCTPRRTPRTTRTTISRPRTGHGSGRSKRYGVAHLPA